MITVLPAEILPERSYTHNGSKGPACGSLRGLMALEGRGFGNFRMRKGGEGVSKHV